MLNGGASSGGRIGMNVSLVSPSPEGGGSARVTRRGEVKLLAAPPPPARPHHSLRSRGRAEDGSRGRRARLHPVAGVAGVDAELGIDLLHLDRQRERRRGEHAFEVL